MARKLDGSRNGDDDKRKVVDQRRTDLSKRLDFLKRQSGHSQRKGVRNFIGGLFMEKEMVQEGAIVAVVVLCN